MTATTVGEPQEKCDLVMKGGITSGVVYPPILSQLANRYRFCNIGGTSAGAIAAAAAAAAEYNRAKGGKMAGFARFQEVSKELTENKTLLHLFDAPRETRPLTSLMLHLGLFGGSIATAPLAIRIVLASILALPITFALGAILGAGLGSLIYAAVLELFPDDLPGAFQVVVFLLGFALVWLAKGFFGFLKRIEQEIVVNLGVILIGVAVGVVLAWGVKLLLAMLLGDNPNTWQVALFVALALLFGYIGGLLTFAIRIAWVLLHNVPGNFQGIVRGHDPHWDKAHSRDDSSPGDASDKNQTSKPSRLLVDWLGERIDQIAGPALQKAGGTRHPLTFDDLSGADITLNMVSTNLSQGLPYKLPFTDDSIFLFRKSQLAKFFPGYIMDWMARHTSDSRVYTLDSKGATCTLHRSNLPGGVAGDYYFVPRGGELPVVVAMRMSLSIPIFFSAIPLYTITAQALAKLKKDPGVTLCDDSRGEGDLRQNWFCDGGTTNNFPIYFFDAWLPSRPTFGINLTAMPTDAVQQNRANEDEISSKYVSATFGASSRESLATDALAKQTPDVLLPRADELQNPEWKPITTSLELFSAMVDAARGGHENLQTMLPGYRDRIVQIRLKKDEGGMNLDMTPLTIEAIQKKGRKAAHELLDKFDFNDHRWTRFLVLMSRLEKELDSMEHAYYKVSPNNNNKNYHELLNSPALTNSKGATRGFPYQRDPAWRQHASIRVEALLEVVAKWRCLQESDEAAGNSLATSSAQVAVNTTSDASVKTPVPPSYETLSMALNCPDKDPGRRDDVSVVDDSCRYEPSLHFFDSETERDAGAGAPATGPGRYASPKPNPVLRVSPEL